MINFRGGTGYRPNLGFKADYSERGFLFARDRFIWYIVQLHVNTVYPVSRVRSVIL